MLHNEALAIRRAIGDVPAVVASIEAIGSLTLITGGEDRAARLLGATEALRDRYGYARSLHEARRYDGDLARLRESPVQQRVVATLTEGAGLSIDEAAALASLGRGRRGRPPSGWSSLTDRERQVAMLVAEGLTNPEIAARLLVSPATVKAHVSRVFPKLDVSSRRELALEVRRREQPTAGLPGR